MGQESVFQFLKKNRGRWFASREIAKALKLSPSSVSTSLMRLRKQGSVFYKQNPKNRNPFLYKVE
ncbi:MAG: MarR family transcriptional regulator [Nanoarchaeota archaeon]|nr:MarR family transcriptional regulator [Nanoarchaeota archaeon]MBU1623319.1 MarR family transcriptional regulator [Nanoarchaeota archaeon]